MNPWRLAAAVGCAAAVLSTTGCERNVSSHEGEGDEAVEQSFTHWGEVSEVYARHPALVGGLPVRFEVWVTDLRTFVPLASGEILLEFEAPGGATTALRGWSPSPPGMFHVDGELPAAGSYRWRLTVAASGLRERHELGEVIVYRDGAAAATQPPPQARGTAVTYPKAEQWKQPFATAAVVEREIGLTLRAPAVVRSAAGAEALVTVPANGRFVGRVPEVGERVVAGQLLGQLEPRLEGLEDLTTLEADVVAKRLAAEEARTEMARADLLLRARAVPARRIDQARHELDLARAELRAAEARLDHRQQTLAQGGSAAGRNAFALLAPIAGTLVSVSATPGAVFDQGAPLFRIVDTALVVVEVQVPESDAARVRTIERASLETPDGGESDALTIRQIRHAGIIDPDTRALPVWLDVANGSGALLVGQVATAVIHTGERRPMLAIPASAVLTERGVSLVFVQVSGETFERRTVRLGARDGNLVGVLEGLEAGERVVTKGAYDVLLTAALPSRPAEGHVH